jgi:hypothetical protein
VFTGVGDAINPSMQYVIRPVSNMYMTYSGSLKRSLKVNEVNKQSFSWSAPVKAVLMHVYWICHFQQEL